ncbi:MAG: transcriptional repressor [Candidatus Gygaella obscura]|nr:transcriptional repressor [Candidatus Gygaella obscura]
MPFRKRGFQKAWQGQIKDAGFRWTMPRQVILNVLANTKDHLSAEDIYLKVHNIYPQVGLTTIYRTLDLLVNMGLVLKSDFGDGRARFEIKRQDKKHHHHLICTKCSRVIDYTDFIDKEVKLLKETEKGLSEKFDFDITGHLIQFYGVCKDCRK